MGSVVEAENIKLQDRVAIKVMHKDLASDPILVQRFLREARAAARLRGEHVVRVHDFGVSDGILYLVMDLLEGIDLRKLLDRGGPLPAQDAVMYITQAASALAEAHGLGIIHRDLKPGNL